MSEKKKIVVLAIVVVLLLAAILFLLLGGSEEDVDMDAGAELPRLELEQQPEESMPPSEEVTAAPVQESESGVVELPFIPVN
ncbi:MAG: hypothetical protein IJX63_13085 [Lachnospiraceae bacterium]|nr:hypothetical protein [Lachnospiraceae bacterium]